MTKGAIVDTSKSSGKVVGVERSSGKRDTMESDGGLLQEVGEELEVVIGLGAHIERERFGVALCSATVEFRADAETLNKGAERSQRMVGRKEREDLMVDGEENVINERSAVASFGALRVRNVGRSVKVGRDAMEDATGSVSSCVGGIEPDVCFGGQRKVGWIGEEDVLKGIRGDEEVASRTVEESIIG